MERKIGEIFTYNGKTYKVVPNSISSCEGCAFKASCFCSADYNIVGECFKYLRNDKTRIIFKHMDIKNNQLIIEIPEGMEIDLKNSDLANGIVKFRKKKITYEDIARTCAFSYGSVVVSNHCIDKLLAISKLMDIAKYYNKDWKPDWNNSDNKYYITYNNADNTYTIDYSCSYIRSNIYFKNKENAWKVISNPNFKDILDKIYKN